MKKLLTLSACLICLIFTLGAYAENKQALDEIIAVVNDDVITNNELADAMKKAKMQLSQEQSAPSIQDGQLQKQVLEQLVNRKLQLQVAKQAGIETSSADVDQAIKRIADQNHVPVEALYERLGQEGMTVSDYRAEIRDQITMQKLQQKEVVNHLTVSPDEIDEFMHSQNWKANSNKQYHLEDILLPLSDTPTPDEVSKAKQQAKAVLAQLAQGKKVDEATQQAGSKTALRHADLGWRKLPEIPSVFAEHISNLEKKKAVGPIQAPNGMHIIRLVDTRMAKAKNAVPDRKQVEQLLLHRKFEEAMQTWVSKLRSQAFITTESDNHNYA